MALCEKETIYWDNTLKLCARRPRSLHSNNRTRFGTELRVAIRLRIPQQRERVHDDPERRALAQPRHDVADHVRCAGTTRLAHHAGAHDESHVWLEEVLSDERNKHEHREASPQGCLSPAATKVHSKQ
jgi:hypothetical protein